MLKSKTRSMNLPTILSITFDILEMLKKLQKEQPTLPQNWTREKVQLQADLRKLLALKKQSMEQRLEITLTIYQISLPMNKVKNNHCIMQSHKQLKDFSNRLTKTGTAIFPQNKLIISLKRLSHKWVKTSLLGRKISSLLSTSWIATETERLAKQSWLTSLWTFSMQCDFSPDLMFKLILLLFFRLIRL